MFCRLIWVYTVCQCPIQGALGTNGLGLVYCFAESDFFTTILSFEAEDTLYQSIIFSLRNLTCSALWENSTDDKLMIFFFSYFPQETGFDISCKLPPIARNVRSCFLRKLRKIYQTRRLLKCYREC